MPGRFVIEPLVRSWRHPQLEAGQPSSSAELQYEWFERIEWIPIDKAPAAREWTEWSECVGGESHATSVLYELCATDATEVLPELRALAESTYPRRLRVVTRRAFSLDDDAPPRLAMAMGATASLAMRDEWSPGLIDVVDLDDGCLLYTSPSPRDATLSRMPSSA